MNKDLTLSGYRLGIDLGGTKTEAVIMDGNGRIYQRRRVDTPHSSYDSALQTIAALALEVESLSGIPSPLPLGIGTPGAISRQTGRMKNCNSTVLNGHALREDLESLTGRPVRIANDADCFALSEARDGAGAGGSIVFGVILGTGVGGGICIDRQILKGVNAIAGEWGHNPLAIHVLRDPVPADTTPRKCYCGRFDCVETWLSGSALSMSYSQVSGIHLGVPEIVRLAENGDGKALAVLEEYINLLALALATVINIVDPEIIVLGGGLSNIDRLYHSLPEYLDHYVFSDRVDTRIIKAIHGDSSGVRGAAWLW